MKSDKTLIAVMVVALAFAASLYIVPVLAHPFFTGDEHDQDEEFPPCWTEDEYECPYGDQHRHQGYEDCPHGGHQEQRPGEAEGHGGYGGHGCGGMMRGGRGRGLSRGPMHNYRRG